MKLIYLGQVKSMFLQYSPRTLKFKNLYFLLGDVCIFILTPILALWLRLDSWRLVLDFASGLLISLSVFIVLKVLILNIFGCYRRCWRFAGIEDLLQIGAACAAICFLESAFIGVERFYGGSEIYVLPRSFPLLDGLLTFIGVGAARFSLKVLDKSARQRSVRQSHEQAHEPVVIYGAGRAGVALAEAIRHHGHRMHPIAFLDDDPKKRDLKIAGLMVVGSREQLPELVCRLNAKRVIIAMPSAGGREIREIVRLCQAHGIPTSTLPSIHEILDGQINLKSLREVKIEDLLRRETIHFDLEEVAPILRSKRVLVSGAGGSIGSEICRQVLQCNPAELILLGHGENSVFLIQQELHRFVQELHDNGSCISTQMNIYVSDLKDYNRLNYAFEKFKPEVVFHAAAHKHVPMMESNSPEAVTNNVLGTQNLVDAALAHNTERLIMISTDKAVNPSSVMGSSKRAGELIVLQAAQRYRKAFSVVRFGNVLGSRGSVVPTLKQQIEKGGPVTITHPEVSRYFMTIPEAVRLVLQATVMQRGGEVYMLNMGNPIKIVDLAQDLIRLSGLELGADIEIVYTGLRPGEKLHEELFLSSEDYEPTANHNLFVVKDASAQVPPNLDEGLRSLIQAALENDEIMVRACFKLLIPGANLGAASQIIPTQKALKLGQLKSAAGSESTKLHRPIVFRSKPGTPLIEANETDLYAAQATQDFKVLYQPILLLQNDYLVAGFEALLHWEHPQHGLIKPRQFIRKADQTQQIHGIGLWGIREVCLQLVALERFNPHPTFTMSVNLSSTQLLHPDFMVRVGEIFDETQVNVARICFEIPEQFVAKQGDVAIALLLRLKGLGVRLLIDNFGVSPIKQLSPLMEWVHVFDGFKVDRSRISELSREAKNLDFLNTALDLSENWGLEMIATGIESSDQVSQIKTLRCKYGQGYFFLRPIEGKQAQALLQGQLVN